MNRYPLWKYLIIIVAVLLGALYTAPNFFPEVPAIQVSSIKATVKVDSALLTRVQNTLKNANIAYGDGFVDPVGVRLKMSSRDTQMQARDVLQEKLGNDYI
ncbi:MAG: protein translocase subunit SecD, partial [Proteobacteria bacterium]|nr:protein translocase subunit SecD [Pseudomonadota bacterium]